MDFDVRNFFVNLLDRHRYSPNSTEAQGVDATRGESCSLASSKHKNRYRIVQGIVKSARKALERRVYECFGSNGNGSPGPTETPSNNSAPNGAPLDSKVQDPCRFVWIPVGDPNKISISNVQENLYTTKFFPLRAISNGLYTVDREFYPHASEVGKDYEGEMDPSCSKKGLASSLYDFIAYGHFNNKYGACNTHACTEKAACIGGLKLPLV
ncbi:hypothetical protein RhiirA5_424754 [Rhizophagus irregularis]|uniref:Uncharacterized protein n=1 Tax=Rhizophagus irregularis TaxID=588596 RepID=A0A2N0P7G1_9GLOM|nr:hypothetical protein RhiirA5_424754 [Rhizophagus irregularis]